MPPPEADTSAAMTQNDSKPSRVSKLPTRPLTRGLDNERRPVSYSATSSGSPRPATTAPPQRNVMSPTTDSRIPRVSQTFSQGLDVQRLRPTSLNLAPRSSHLPRTASTRNAATSNSPAELVRVMSRSSTLTNASLKDSKTASLRTDTNKPLPSPPIVQVIDPNSPPKAQRTLVDAEAGAPSQDQWPVLHPEDVSPLENTLTTHEKAYVQQQPATAINELLPVHDANQLGEDRNTRSTSASALREERAKPSSIDHTVSTRDDGVPQPAEPRRLSSNNPYAKEINAIAPDTDASTSNTGAHNTIVSTLLSVPPRISSKRSSLPVSSHEQVQVPVRSTSSCSNTNKHDHNPSPRVTQESEKTLAADTNQPDTNHSWNTAVSTTSSSHESDRVELSVTPTEQVDLPVAPVAQGDLSVASVEQSVEDPNDTVTSEFPYFLAGAGAWATDLSTGWMSREFRNGQVLRVSPHADDMLVGDPSRVPQDPSDLCTVRTSLGRILRRNAPPTVAPVNVGIATTTDIATPARSPQANTSVAISPIRAMRPARRPSAMASPRNFSTPTRPSPLAPQDVNEITPVAATTNTAAEAESPTSEIGFMQALYETAPNNGSARDVRQGRRVRIESPPAPRRRSGGFMAPTASSARRASETRSSGGALRVRVKRSLRTLFTRSEAPSAENREAQSNELQNLTERQSALTAVAAVSSSTTPGEPLAYYPVETAATVNAILAHVLKDKEAPESDTGLKVAETVVKMAELARELDHKQQSLASLLQHDFKDETLRSLVEGLKESRMVKEMTIQRRV